MPMNKLICARLTLTLLVAALSGPVLAQDKQDQAPETAGAEIRAQEQPQRLPEKSDTATQDKVGEKTPPADVPAAGQLKELNPTDKIQADSAVSFPIDI